MVTLVDQFRMCLAAPSVYESAHSPHCQNLKCALILMSKAKLRLKVAPHKKVALTTYAFLLYFYLKCTHSHLRFRVWEGYYTGSIQGIGTIVLFSFTSLRLSVSSN